MLTPIANEIVNSSTLALIVARTQPASLDFVG